jgi:hypothetical protein
LLNWHNIPFDANFVSSLASETFASASALFVSTFRVSVFVSASISFFVVVDSVSERAFVVIVSSLHVINLCFDVWRSSFLLFLNLTC